MNLLNTFLCVSMLLAFSVGAQSAKQFYDESAELFTKKDLSKANIAIDKAIAIDSADAYLYRKIDIFYQQNNCDEAFPILNRIIERSGKIDDDVISYYAMLSDCIGKRKEVEPAIIDHADRTESVKILKILSGWALLDKDFDCAKSYCLRILKADPKNIEGYIDLARIYNTWKKEDEAEATLKEGLKVNKDNPTLLNALAGHYYLQSQYSKAADIYTTLLKSNPESGYYESRGILRQKMNLLKEALDDFKIALSKQPCNTRILKQVSDIEILQKNFKDAVATCEKAISCDVSNEQIFLDNCYTSYLFLHQNKKALPLLKKRLENKADNAHPYLMHAILLIDEKNYSQAQEALQTASIKNAEHQNSQLIRLLELGSYLLAEKYDELKLFLAASQKGKDMPAVFKLGPNEAAQKINLKIDFNEKTGMVDASLRLSGEYINSLKEKGIDLRVE